MYNKSMGQFNAKNKRLTISIAMYTFNCSDYLPEQLDSIDKQTRLPDSLVACDDISTDSNLKILNKFWKNTPFQIRIYRNDKKYYSAKNFEKAINICKDDVIVLSDQEIYGYQINLKKLIIFLEIILKRWTLSNLASFISIAIVIIIFPVIFHFLMPAHLRTGATLVFIIPKFEKIKKEAKSE